MNDKEISAAIIEFCMEERVFSQFCTYMGEFDKVQDRWKPTILSIQMARHILQYAEKMKPAKLTLPLQKGKKYKLGNGKVGIVGWSSYDGSVCEILDSSSTYAICEVSVKTGKNQWGSGDQWSVVEDAE